MDRLLLVQAAMPHSLTPAGLVSAAALLLLMSSGCADGDPVDQQFVDGRNGVFEEYGPVHIFNFVPMGAGEELVVRAHYWHMLGSLNAGSGEMTYEVDRALHGPQGVEPGPHVDVVWPYARNVPGEYPLANPEQLDGFNGVRQVGFVFSGDYGEKQSGGAYDLFVVQAQLGYSFYRGGHVEVFYPDRNTPAGNRVSVRQVRLQVGRDPLRPEAGTQEAWGIAIVPADPAQIDLRGFVEPGPVPVRGQFRL